MKTASSAVNLLIDMGYFPRHVNLDLLKLNIRTDHSDGIIAAAESLLLEASDPDEVTSGSITGFVMRDNNITRSYVYISSFKILREPYSLSAVNLIKDF